MKLRHSLFALTALTAAGITPLAGCSGDEPTGTAGTGGGNQMLGGSSGQGAGGTSGKATSGGTGGQGTGGVATGGTGGGSGSSSAGIGGAENPCPNSGGMNAVAGRYAAYGGKSGGAGMSSGGQSAGTSAGGQSAGGMSGSGGMAGTSMGGDGAGGLGSGGRGGRSAGGGMSAGGMSGMAGSGTAGSGTAGSGTAGSGTAGSGTAGSASEDPYPPTFENLKFVLTAPTPACTASDCHGVNGPNIFWMTTRDDDFLYNSLLTHYSINCGNLPVVSPGHPEQSALIKILKGPCAGPCTTTDRMPKDCTPEMENCIPDDMISSIEKWILAGAPR